MNLYLWLKSFHVISVIAWMAAMLYLPRLFVYHAAVPVGSAQSELFKVMERRLYKAIMLPAMIATWLFGLSLLATGAIDLAGSGWLHAKLALVLVMSGLHGAFGRWRRDFEQDRNVRSARFYRIANEAPTLLLIVIVILVIGKPF